MRTFLTGCAACLIVTGAAQAQMQKHWARCHNGSGNSEDYGYDIAVDAAGNSYVTGGATNALGVGEVVLVKYGPSGQEEWARTWAGPGGGPDYGTRVAIDPGGNIVVGADTLGVGTDYDLTTLEYDPQGNLLWSRTFNGTGNGYDGMGGGWSLVIGSAGEVFVGGYTYDATNGSDSLILKYDTNGTLLWTAIYDGPDHLGDDNYGLVLDAAGNVYAAAESSSFATGRDLLALKHRGSDGALLWATSYDSPSPGSHDIVNAIAIDASANVYVVGYGPDATGDDIITMKVDTSGALQWVRRWDGPHSGNDAPWDVAVDGPGGVTGLVAVTGVTSTRYQSSAVTVAYDTSGNQLWVQLFDASAFYFGDDEFFDVEIDSAGHVWAAGFGWDGPEHGAEATLVEYAPDGTQLFADVLDGSAHADDTSFGLALRGTSVYVGGLSQRGERHLDTLVVRYGKPFRQIGPPVPYAAPEAAGDDSSLHESARLRRAPVGAGRPERPRSPLSAM